MATHRSVDSGRNRGQSGNAPPFLKKVPWRLLSLPAKLLAVLAALFLLYILFCRLDWAAALNWPGILQLRDNLDFLTAFIDRYPWLAALSIVLIPLLLLAGRFSLNSTTFTVLGLELQFRQTESAVKAQMKNFLSAKRAIFVYYEDYDNYYDCINSMYKTLLFLREQLENFERFSQTNTDSYEHIEGMIQEIGRFLTKYQSDYRRYYETEIEALQEDPSRFVFFLELQEKYPKNREMAADFYRLNDRMEPHARFFDIDIDKWKWEEWTGRPALTADGAAEASPADADEAETGGPAEDGTETGGPAESDETAAAQEREAAAV